MTTQTKTQNGCIYRRESVNDKWEFIGYHPNYEHKKPLEVTYIRVEILERDLAKEVSNQKNLLEKIDKGIDVAESKLALKTIDGIISHIKKSIAIWLKEREVVRESHLFNAKFKSENTLVEVYN